MDPGDEAPLEISDTVFLGLQEPARELLLRLLLYKSVFIGRGFRTLAARETDERLREHLLRISRESAEETAATAQLVREWDRHPGVWGRVSETIEATRERLLRDLIHIKEGITEMGLSAAMRAPTVALRDRFLKLVDTDRRHADELRAFLGTTTTADFEDAHGHGVGAHDARGRRLSLGGAMRQSLSQLEGRGVRAQRVVLSPDGLRHLRDEMDISEDGRWMGLPIDIDVGWIGDVFALETEERLTFADLVVAAKAGSADSAGGPHKT